MIGDRLFHFPPFTSKRMSIAAAPNAFEQEPMAKSVLASYPGANGDRINLYLLTVGEGAFAARI